ncbi:class II fructose-bisphosphate aldolase [Ammoniphilus sp. CFH 90114]|uniref:class II fructose-bisphosphate aldolase n=1 Tax=Ammoniphilus sp. CFH 90114 TaxID=2493665 RepID=UPI00100F09CC|nr:class II fructose-bisphosphate aldolase [Ammoniphilus sp. CFH 90114]RXT05284.1 class II fructose-bisphosphate aldolase [Ammoniphilus sp. CFH 90114]
MLVDTTSILQDAQKNRYAVAAFSVYSLETAQAAINVANREKNPVILAVGERYFSSVDVEGFASFIQTVAQKTTAPIALHLDHAYQKQSILRAIRSGFTSVMYDGSSFSFEENVRLTKDMAEIAHLAGVSIEAEIGSLAKGAFSDEEEGNGILTDPRLAEEFVNETNVDFLAAAIGTVHGMYVTKPKIDLKRLEQIRERVHVPLVLHGGSDTPDEILKQVIERGICKINVNTEISMEAVSFLTRQLNDKPGLHLSVIMEEMQEVIENSMTRFVRLFSNI